MLSYFEYKKIYNIAENEYIEFLDVTSWKKGDQKNSPQTTNNSNISNYVRPTKLEILSQLKKEFTNKVKIYEEGIHYYTMHYNKRKLTLYIDHVI